MYRIGVLTDKKKNGETYAKMISDYCITQKLFPLLETYQDQEIFFKEIQRCGIIWCSDLDFSLHAFRLRIEYFFLEPVNELKIQEGLKAWFRSEKRSFK